MPWHFERCVVVGVRDGDTYNADIDQGLNQKRERIGVRFLRTKAPELKDPGGPEAKARLQELLPPGTVVEVTSAKWDKYANRIDGLTTLPDGRDLEGVLLDEGFVTRR